MIPLWWAMQIRGSFISSLILGPSRPRWGGEVCTYHTMVLADNDLHTPHNGPQPFEFLGIDIPSRVPNCCWIPPPSTESAAGSRGIIISRVPNFSPPVVVVNAGAYHTRVFSLLPLRPRLHNGWVAHQKTSSASRNILSSLTTQVVRLRNVYCDPSLIHRPCAPL